MLRHVALVRSDVSEELSPSIIRAFLRSLRQLLVKVNVVPSSPILVTLVMEAILLPTELPMYDLRFSQQYL
jgi:hypothetical protein